MPRETTTQRKRRLAKQKLKRLQKLANETLEEKEQRLQKKREIYARKKVRNEKAEVGDNQSEPSVWKPGQVGNLLKVRKKKYQKEINTLPNKDQSEREWQHGLQASTSKLLEFGSQLYEENVNPFGGQLCEQEKMASSTSFPTSSEIADLQTVIKEENDIDHTITEDIDIKSEIHVDETVVQERTDNPFNVEVQVKQEIISLSLEREDDSQNEDSVSKIVGFDDDNKDDNMDHYVTVPKCEMDCDEKSEVKKEVVRDDSVVTYDYPNFDDVGSMDSNEAVALNQVEACLQDDVNIKCEDDDHFVVDKSKKNLVGNLELSDDSNAADSFPDESELESDEDYDPQEDPANKSQSKATGVSSASKQKCTSNSDSSSEYSCDDSDTETDLDSDSSQSSVNTSSNKFLIQHIQESKGSEGPVCDSSTSADNCPQAKRLKLSKNLRTERPIQPVVAEGQQALESRGPDTNESGTQICPDLTPNEDYESLHTTSAGKKWIQTIIPIPYHHFDINSVGVKFSIDKNTTVVDVFNRLFPPSILDYVIECTNAYGKHLCLTNKTKSRNSRFYSFKPTNRGEMLKFLGLCLLAGQVNVPQMKKLFTMSDVLYYHPIFVSTMSGRRFEQLLNCLYAGPLNAKGKEKITEFMDAICRHFRECYSPEKELSLAEPLLLYKGRLSFRQYVKSIMKSKFGIKFYELTDANGYVLNIHIHVGKDEKVEKDKRIEKTVLRLMRPYVLKGHDLYMDIYYNSYALSQKLLDLKTHTNGMLRKNRKGNPKTLVGKKIKVGEHVWARKSNVYVSKWVDKRSVAIITTKDHPKMINTANRRGRKQKPVEWVTCNKYMTNLECAEQIISYYSSPRKCLRWYKKVFFHLLDLAVWNSFYIYRKYKKNNNRKYDFLNFREELIRDLINVSPDKKPDVLIGHSKYDNRKVNRVVDPGPARIRLDDDQGGHWPEKIPPPLGSKRAKNYLKCKLCARNKLRKETGLRCKGCTDKPALCGSCFEEWHNTIDWLSSS